MIKISKKKSYYDISPGLHDYLNNYDRAMSIPVSYDILLNYSQSFPLIDKNNNDTYWESLTYDQHMKDDLHKNLTILYSNLKSSGDVESRDHLFVDRIDFCTFGNSKPFRIRIKNQYNDNYDYFYIKKTDASRIYGLELEHLLSPNRISFFVNDDSLIEEHIAGIPGDDFIKNYLTRKDINQVRIAKEFIKFNERCFIRLLGDMRSYNYVIEITPDFEEEQYRVRPIDFDQQSYEGDLRVYFAQFFKENKAVLDLCTNKLNPQTIRQYQIEEHSLIARRYKASKYKLDQLLYHLKNDVISKADKIDKLKRELADYHKNVDFLECKSMGDLIQMNIENTLGDLIH